MFGANKLTRNEIETKFMNNRYGVVFSIAWSLSSGNVFITNVKSCKNNYQIVCEGPTDYINENAGGPEKGLSINFTNSKTKLCLSLH